MNRALLLLPATLAFAGCNSNPSVTAENASVNEVNAKLSESGGVSRFLSPGHWDSVTTIRDLEMPGLPPAEAARMKTMLNKPTQNGSCLTPEEAKQPAGSFFSGGEDNDCRYDHFTMTGGTVDAAMTCKSEEGTQAIAFKGNYTSDTFHLDMSTKATGATPGPMSNMTMAASVDAKRTGACTGHEDD